MTTEQRSQIQAAIRTTPKTIWAYWPFLLPVLLVVAGAVFQIVLVEYFKSKVPDLEVLFKHGTRVDPVLDSDLIRQAVLVTSGSIVITIFLFVYLAGIAFKYATLLKVMAKDAGIDER